MGKQKLCVLRLVVEQGQLQIVKVRLYEDEIDRLIGSHNDHLSWKGCAGGMRQLHDVCDAGIEFVIESTPSQHPKRHKEPPGACSGVWQSQEKTQKGPSVSAWPCHQGRHHAEPYR